MFSSQCHCLGRRRLQRWLNSITLPSWLLGFSPQVFSTTISSLTSPWTSLCTVIYILLLPGAVIFRGLASLLGLGMAAARIVCVILTPFRLSQVSYFTLSLKCFSSVPNNCPTVGIRPLFQFPHLARAGPVLETLLFFALLPSSYWISHGFQWSGTLVHPQLVFFKIFCVWRCSPDVSMERDVLYIHLLLCQLVFCQEYPWF